MKPRTVVVINLSSRFKKSFKKLPHRIQRLTEQKVRWFQTNAHDARLKTHALSGALDGYWSFSVNREYRILFQFRPADAALFVVIGTHAIYR